MNIRDKLITVLLLTITVVLPSCTIGVANGSVTADGRPLLWKTRDSSGIDNGLVHVTNEGYLYTAVFDPEDDGAWMGVNEHGFGILNAYSGDLEQTRYDNGSLMRLALATCITVDDFETLLQDTNTVGRETLSNFGVIDAEGNAAIFETGFTFYVRYDTPAEGWLIRANFSQTGGGNAGLKRYQRAQTITSSLVTADSLSVRSLLHTHMRDVVNSQVSPITIPYAYQWTPGQPYGYIDTDWSICSNTTVSGAVIQGVLLGDPPTLTTLWVIAGNPFCTPVVAAWPVCESPQAASMADSTASAITARAQAFKMELFDYPLNSRWLDTWKLSDGAEGGLWPGLFAVEDDIIQTTDSLLAQWRIALPDTASMSVAANDVADKALDWMLSAELPTAPQANFFASPLSGTAPLTVQFTDRTLHYAQTWAWDFDSDGVIDSDQMNPSHIYTQPGIYSVRLIVGNGADTLTSNDIIEVLPAEEVDAAWLAQSYPNPFSYQAVINYNLARAGHVRLRVYNIRGQLVQTLVDEWQEPGVYAPVWNPTLSPGRRVAAGVYIYMLDAPGITAARRMVYIP